MSIEGTKPIRIWDKSVGAAISPDGNWVRIIDEQKIMLIPAEGGEPVETYDLNSEWGSLSAWTPDGRAFLYVKTINGVANVWQRKLDGSEPIQLTSFDSGGIGDVDMSTDGKNLAVMRYSTTSDVVLIKDLNVK